MPPRTVSPAVAALIHHVELSRAGWWDRTVQQVALGCLRDAPAPLTFEATHFAVETSLQRKIPAEYFNNLLRELMTLGHISELPGIGLRLSESALKHFAASVSDIEENDREIERLFVTALEASGLTVAPDAAWRVFLDSALSPMIADLGARTYELLSGVAGANDSADYLARFLESFPQEAHARLTNVAIAVLDPKNPAVRQFILRELNTRFVLEAAGLSSHVLDQLGKASGKRPRVLLFVDTNFLFSLLSLHANPANEAAELLLDLLRQIDAYIDASLVVLPTTLDEARTRLGVEIDRLRGLVLTPRLAQSVHDGDLSGLAQRYVQEIARGSVRLSPADFFGPYHDDLLKFARAKDVELYNESMDRVTRNQDVIDETLDRLKFEEGKYKKKAKLYEQLLHDVALRHVALSKRAVRIESPLDAAAWVVTVDYRLLGYDRHKTLASRGQVPVCIHPAVLTQLLQFWVPRTPEFETALVASMRLPFFFSSFDPEAERVTVKILGTLGRFENVDQLPEGTITNLLASQALRQRMAGPLSVEERIKEVESAIVKENIRVQSLVERERERRRLVEQENEERKRALVSSASALAAANAESEVRQREVARLAQELEQTREHERRRSTAFRFVTRFALPALVGATVLSALGSLLLSQQATFQMWQTFVVAEVCSLLIVVAILQLKPDWSIATAVWPSLGQVPNAWKLALAGFASLLGYVLLTLLGDPIVAAIRQRIG